MRRSSPAASPRPPCAPSTPATTCRRRSPRRSPPPSPTPCPARSADPGDPHSTPPRGHILSPIRSTFRSARLAAIGILTVGALVLTACGGSPEPQPTASGAVDPNAELTVGLVLEPTNLDIRRTSGAALEQILVDNIYEGLVTRTQDNTIEDRL